MFRIAIAFLAAVAACYCQDATVADLGFRKLCSLIARDRIEEAKTLAAPELGKALSGPSGSQIITLAKEFDKNANKTIKGPIYRKTTTAQAEVWILKDGVAEGVDLALSVVYEQSLIVGIFKI